MRDTTLTRIAVLGTAAAVCLGTAVPASAHSLSDTNDRTTGTSSTPSLAQVQAWVDSFIAKRQQHLASYASKVAADPKLTDAQKADFASKIAAQQAALTSLKSAMDSAGTVDAVHQAVKAAMASDGVHGFFGWCGFFGEHHRDGIDRDGIDRDGKAPARHSATVRDRTDPGRAKGPASTARTVVVRSGEHAPTLQPARTVGAHRSANHGRQALSDGSYQG
ncbi:MAG: hypothetical protein ABI140_04915, partial [Jatrophihabitantaceae bacterium]